MPKHNGSPLNGPSLNGPPIKDVPDPQEAIDTAVQAAMYVPKLPADIISGVGTGLTQMGNEMHSAADRAGTGPTALVPAAVDYVAAIPRGVIGIIRGAAGGVDSAISGFQGKIRNLG